MPPLIESWRPLLMSDKGGGAGGAGGSGGDGGGNDDGVGGGAGGGGDDKGGDTAALKAALKEERAARQQAEKSFKALEQKVDGLIKGATTSVEQRAADDQKALLERLDGYTVKLRRANGKEAIQKAAKKAGAPDADLIYDLVRADLSFGEDDEPDNVNDLIEGAQERYPDLFKVRSPRGDQGGGARGGTAHGIAKDPLRAIAFPDD